ncbi:MAG: aminotransferase class V-fold PLP-dependent enzyme [Alphaproteobacteria bacterium]|nr:aminotransferase class V-fold PLP-dependent enzyme [Alphaproteobacteria bacterium]
MHNDRAEKPVYGAAIRGLWALDPEFLTVNHGSFGATPLAVLAAQDEWRRQLEAQPSRFMRRVLPGALREAAARLAAFLNAEADDLAFVDNATVGCNAVLRSLRLGRGDEILVFDHGYAAVRNAARHVAERGGARVVEAKLPFPDPSDDAITAAFKAALTPRTRLAIVDHITSPSALVMPVARLASASREAGVPIMVDGAHGPGQVTMDLGALGADWYAGNCHKWLSAPKGCAFLWARRDRQQDLHPVTISHGYGQGFLAEFDWTGTRDPSAFLAVGAAIDLHERLGGAALRRRNAELAREGARRIADALGTQCGGAPAMYASMGLVRLPVPGPATRERAVALRERLLVEFRTDAPLHALGGSIWLRLSAAAYNEPGDYAALAGIARRLAGLGN